MYGLFSLSLLFFFFNDTATTEIYTLSLHDALPICGRRIALLLRRSGDHPHPGPFRELRQRLGVAGSYVFAEHRRRRSEEHTSELQSRQYLVCRLLLEKKKKMYLHH